MIPSASFPDRTTCSRSVNKRLLSGLELFGSISRLWFIAWPTVIVWVEMSQRLSL